MSNIETVETLLTAIEHVRFDEIEALHRPDASFRSFRGPNAVGSVAVGDWYREFLRDYADCLYVDRTLFREGDSVALHATISAKNVDWRPFSQRVVEIAEITDDQVSARRIYAMPAGIEFEKPASDVLKKFAGHEGGKSSDTTKIARGFFEALFAGDQDGAKERLDESAVAIDGVFGTAVGADNVVDFLGAIPRPAFGAWHLGRSVASASEVAVELTIDPGRPRLVSWVRVMDEKIVMLEAFWMLREIGVQPAVDALPRHPKLVVYPI